MENQNLNIGPYAYQQLRKLYNPVVAQLMEVVHVADIVGDSPNSMLITGFGNENSDIIKRHKGKERKDTLKTGRLLRTLMDHYHVPAKANVLENIFNELKASMLDLEIHIVKGDDIKKYYNQVNYENPGYFETTTFEGTLSKSCMRFPFCEKWLDLYSKNEGIVEMWVVTNDDKLQARALVWTDTTGKKILDRVYYTTIEQCYYFMNRAKELGYYLVDTPSWDPENEPMIFTPDGKLVDFITIRLKNKSMYEFPYLDAFPYYDIIEGVLTNNFGYFEHRNPILRLKSLTGRLKTKHVTRWPSSSSESKMEIWASTVPLLCEKNGPNHNYKYIYTLAKKYPYNAKHILKYSRIEERYRVMEEAMRESEFWLFEYINFHEEYFARETMSELWANKDIKPFLLKNHQAYWSLLEKEMINIINIDPLVLFHPIQRTLDRIKIPMDFMGYIQPLHDYLLTRSTTDRNTKISTFENNLTHKINYTNYLFKYLNVENWLYYMKFRWWKKDYTILSHTLNVLEHEDSYNLLDKIIPNPIFVRLITEIKKEHKTDMYIQHWANKLKI